MWATEEELAAIAEHTGKSIGEVKLLHTRLVGKRVSLTEHANGDCTFFDPQTRRCNIYPVRPVQCRTWPFWTSNLESPDTWKALHPECPGVGNGDFVSLDEIESRVSQIEI